MFVGVTVVFVGITVVEGVVWELRFTGVVCGCVVVFAGKTGKLVTLVSDSSADFPLPQARQINMNDDTAK